MNCDINPETLACTICGRSVPIAKVRRNCTGGDGRSKGLGDTIAKITTAIGIKPCGGCKDRQAALNKLVPYKPAE